MNTFLLLVKETVSTNRPSGSKRNLLCSGRFHTRDRAVISQTKMLTFPNLEKEIPGDLGVVPQEGGDAVA